MKAPPFAYVRARSLPEVFSLLDAHGDGAKLLAGGQSLIAALNMRLAAPEILIDITAVPGLSGITVSGGKVCIGALTTHAEIEHSSEIAKHLPLLTLAAPHIAHIAIRNAGTFGGSIAMADPAAEWPACCVALDADFVIASKSGNRRAKARTFFKGPYATELQANEVLTAIEFVIPDSHCRHAFLELARRRGDYAIVGVAAAARLASGTFSDVQLAYFGIGATPVLARGAMAAAEGIRPSSRATEAAAAALDGDLDPGADIYSAAPTKMHLARVLTRRALDALAA